MKLSLQEDPSYAKVLVIAILLVVEALLANLLIQLQAGQMPTEIQWLTMGCVAGLQLVTYLLTFLRKEVEGEG